MDVTYIIFHPHKYLIFVLNHLKQSPFCCSSGNMCMQCKQFYPHFYISAFLHSLCLSPNPHYLSVSWTSCSVALKYGTLCRSVDLHSALHPESECSVNDTIIFSKAMLNLPLCSFFKCKGWLHETVKLTVRFTWRQCSSCAGTLKQTIRETEQS